MKIDFISDLHFEINTQYPPKLEWVDKDADTLILLGDICNFKDLDPSATDAGARGNRKRIERFLKEFCSHYKTILYIPGNHEYYGFYFQDSQDEVEKLLRAVDNRIIYFNDRHYTEGDVSIIGSTFWTNFNNNDHMAKVIVSNMLNDYIMIRNEKGGFKLKPDTIYDAHHASYLYLYTMTQFCKAENRKIIVATHHAPSFKSHDPNRVYHDSDFGFYSALDDFILDCEFDYWLHGHTHYNVSYEIGKTKIRSSMYGYYGYDIDNRCPPLKIGRIEI